MPDRILRADILTSDPVSSLSWPAEVFYRRAMSVADDFGRYEARPSLLRASLYPVKLDKVSNSDVTKWMRECVEAGLIRLYTVEDKEYFEISKFGQRLRAMRSKYPSPSSDNIRRHPLSSAAETKRIESESETESKPKDAGEPAVDLVFVFDSEIFKTMWNHWKVYKSKDCKFHYKSKQSEQAALNELTSLAGGKENTALQIIQQSMAKGWKGFFPLKTNTNGSSESKADRLSSIQEKLSKRYANGGPV